MTLAPIRGVSEQEVREGDCAGWGDIRTVVIRVKNAPPEKEGSALNLCRSGDLYRAEQMTACCRMI